MALKGGTIRLREQRIEDMPLLVELKNDLDTQAWSIRLAPDLTLSAAEQAFREKKTSTSTSPARFMIEEIGSNEVVGFASYYGVKHRLSAVIGVALRKEFFGKGFGYEACDVLMKFLFHEMGMKVLYWYTTSYNEPSVKLGLKLGFKEGLRMRKSTYIAGDYFDGITLDILREEFYEKHPELI